LALKTGRTKAFYLREIIEAASPRSKSIIGGRDLERVRKGQEKVHSASSVEDLALEVEYAD